MNITVLGATGKTGIEIVKQALETRHSVTALVRQQGSLETNSKLNVIIGDVTNATDIEKASKNADVIISALGAMSGSLMTDATNAVISASKATGVKRFIVMSSFAVRKDQLSGAMKLMTGLAMGKVVKDKSESETILRKSGLDWTIVYATGLTNSEKSGKVKVLNKSETLSMKNKIARADVADWMLKEAQKNDYIKAEAIISN